VPISSDGRESPIAGYEFGEYFMDLDTATLQHADQPVHLRPQTYEVLRHLLANDNRLVSKGEIIDSVWGGAAVSDDSVTQCIKEIRKALGDGSQKYIRTVPRRGFVFALPVQERLREAGDTNGEGHPSDNGLPIRQTRPALDTTPKSDSESSSQAGNRLWLTALKASIAIVLVVVVGGQYFDSMLDRSVRDATKPAAATDGEVKEKPSEPSVKSIAVLPFDDLTPRADKQYFADGVADELLNLLAQLPNLRVVSRTSSFAYRGEDVDIPTIGRELDVAFVLDGSIRSEDDRIRVSAYLVETATDTNLWAATYDDELAGIFDIQDDIASAIVDKLRIHLVNPQPRSRRTSPKAYELYMEANHIARIQMLRSKYAEAYELTKKVLELDSTYVPALTLQAQLAYRSLPDHLGFPITEELLKEPLRRALQIEPNDAVANAYMGYLLMVFSGDIKAALIHANTALAAEPQNAEVLRVVGTIAGMMGKFDEGIELIRRAKIRDPNCRACDLVLFPIYLNSGRFDEAEYHLNREREENRNVGWEFEYINLLLSAGRNDEAQARIDAASTPETYVWYEGVRAVLWCQLGDQQSFSQSLANAIDFANQYPSNPMALSISSAYACAGDNDEAFRWLERSRAVVDASLRPPWELWLAIVRNPQKEPLHGDPRWTKFRDSVGMAASKFEGIELRLPPENAGAIVFQQHEYGP
jgi:adenylate cyclase